MSLHAQIVSLQKQFDLHPRELERDRARHPELAPYPTGRAVVTALGKSSPLSKGDRFALVGVLVACHGDTGHSLWVSILLKAFEPLLLRIRKEMRRPEDEELDHRVLFAFLKALALPSVRNAGTSALLAVERATRRYLTRERSRDHDADLVPFDDAVYWNGGHEAVALAEARVDALWAERRAARAVAHVRWVRASFDSRRRAA
jgi:hypothetical protein